MKNLKKAIILAAVLSAQTLVSTRAHAFIFPLCLFHNIGSVSSEDVSSCAKEGIKSGTIFGAALGILTLNPGFFAVGAVLAFMDSDENDLSGYIVPASFFDKLSSLKSVKNIIRSVKNGPSGTFFTPLYFYFS